MGKLRKIVLALTGAALLAALVADLCISRQVGFIVLKLAGVYFAIFIAISVIDILIERRRKRHGATRPRADFGSRAIHLLEFFFFIFGCVVLYIVFSREAIEKHFGAIGAEPSTNRGEALAGILAPALFFALFGACMVIDWLTERTRQEDAGAKDEKIRFRVMYVVWYLFVSAGPLLLVALICEAVYCETLTRVEAFLLMGLLIGSFAAFVAVDRAVVRRRRRREASGEIREKKTRLIHLLQGFFVLILLTGLLIEVLVDRVEVPYAGVGIAVGAALALVVCLIIERATTHRPATELRAVHGAYAYCIPFGLFCLALGIAGMVLDAGDPSGAFLMAGFCLLIIVIAFVIDRVARRKIGDEKEGDS